MSHDVIRDVTRFGLARPSPAIWPVGPAQTLTAGPQIFESKHLSGCLAISFSRLSLPPRPTNACFKPCHEL